MSFLGRVTRLMPVLKLSPRIGQVRHIKRWVAPTLKQLYLREKKLGGKKTNPRNTFLEWNFEAELYAFGKRLNEEFDGDLLLEAFTDRSYVIKEEAKQKELGVDIQIKDNRILATEGEKFIKDYVQQYLEHVLPRFPLAGIAGVREYLMSEAVLANVSSHLGTKDIILAAEYPVDNTILATTFKAIVGALVQSSSEERAAHFIRDFLITQLHGQDVNEFWPIDDPWAMLVDVLKIDKTDVEPRLIGETGKNTILACYRVGLYVDKRIISAGFGETVDVAKEMASREALKKLFGTQENMPPINFQIDEIPKKDASEKRYQISTN